MSIDNRPDVVEVFSTLSAEETVFVYAYCNCFNATEAYLKVQPDVADRSCAATMGWNMMRRPQVKTAVAAHLEERKQNYELDFRLILHNLLAIANADLSAFMDSEGNIDPILIKNAPIEVRRCVESLGHDVNNRTGETKVKLKMKDSLKAAELIGKHLKMWTEKVELGGPDGKELAFTVTQKPYKAEPEPNDKG